MGLDEFVSRELVLTRDPRKFLALIVRIGIISAIAFLWSSVFYESQPRK